MEMIATIVVYSLTSILLGVLGWHCVDRENKLLSVEKRALSFWSWEIMASIALFVLVFGLRFNTGNDYLGYLYQYYCIRDGMEYIRENFEKGFLGVTMLFAKSNIHYFFYFSFWTLLQIGSLYYALRERKFLFLWIGALLILGPFSFDWLTFLRQWTVAFMFVAVIPLIQQRKFWLFLGCILLFMTIHKMAAVLIPFYWVTCLQCKDGGFKRWVYFLILALCAILSLRPYWIYLFNFMQPFLDYFGYDRYNRQWEVLMNNFPGGWGLTPTFLIKLMIAGFMIYFYPHVRERHPDDKLLPIYFHIAVIGLFFIILVNNLPILLERPVNTTFIFILISSGYVLDYLFHEKKWWLLLALLGAICMTYVIIAAKFFIDPVSIGENKVFYHFMHLF